MNGCPRFDWLVPKGANSSFLRGGTHDDYSITSSAATGRLTGLSAHYCAAAQALIEGVEGNNLSVPRSEHSILKRLHEGSQMLYEVLWMNVAT